MKKIIICNIPMKEDTHKCRYQSEDLSLPTSEREVVYPINAFLEKTLNAEDALMPYEFLDEVIWRIENLNQSIDNMMQNEFLYEKKNKVTKETKNILLKISHLH